MKAGDIVLSRFPRTDLQNEASVINGRIGRISQSRLKEIRNRLADWLKTQKLTGA